MSEITGTTTQGSTEANPQVSEGGEASESQGTQATGGQGGQTGNAAGEAAKEAMRKFKIKHQDGNEEEVDEETVLRTYRERKGHQSAANKALQEGKAKAKQAEEFIKMMKDKKTLFEAIKKLGHDPRNLSEEYLTEQLQEEMMDPREKELRDAKRRVEEYESKEKAAVEREEKRKLDILTKKFSEKYNTEIIDALKATPIPQNQVSVGKMAAYMGRAAKIGFEMTAAEAAKLVQEDHEQEKSLLLKNATPEQILKFIGEEGLQKIRAYDAAQIRSPQDHLKTPIEQGDVGSRSRNTVKRFSHREWRDYNRK
jgi:hypothetical protein